MLGDQRVELRGRLGRAPALEVDADPALERRESQLVESRGDQWKRGLSARSLSDGPRQSASAARSSVAAASGRPAALLGRAACGPLLEALQVQRTVGRDQRVAAAPG